MKKSIVIIGVIIGLLGLALGVWRLPIVSAAEGFVYTANERENSISAIDVGTGDVKNIVTRITPHNVQVSRDGRLLLAVGPIADLTAKMKMPEARAQTPDEHASHHPGQAGSAMPAGAPTPTSGMPVGGGMMGQMGEMMKSMGAPPPKELYPALMALPELSPEQREQVEKQADKQMRAGSVLMAQARDSLKAGTRSGDYAVMQEALTRLREGIAQLESGIAARRALAEGRMPRAVALQWFKREMNLLPPAVSAPPHGWYADSTFHLIVLLILALFAAAMIWMSFFKMRRAADLLGRLSAGAPAGDGSKPGAPLPGSSKPVPAVAAQAPAEVAAKPVAEAASEAPPPAADGSAATPAVSVTFKKSGKTASLPPDNCILEAAEAVGVKIENGCRVGACGACKVKLLSGAVTMEVEDSLSAEEKAGGTILACQAKSTGEVVVDA